MSGKKEKKEGFKKHLARKRDVGLPVRERPSSITREMLSDLLDIEPTLVGKILSLAFNIVGDRLLKPRKGGEAELQFVQDFFDVSKNFHSAITHAVYDAFWSGTGWLTLISNQSDDEFIEVERVDPLVIDLKRDSFGNPVLDEFGKPKTLILNRNNSEEEVSADSFCLLRFVRESQSPLGRSLLLGAYNAIVIKANVEMNLGKLVENTVHRPIILKVGSKDTKEWSQAAIKALYDDFEKPYELENVVVPWDVEILPLETPPIVDVTNVLFFFENLINESLLLPLTHLSSRGRRVTALESIEPEWENVLRGCRQVLAEQLETEMFTKIVGKRGGDPSRVPKIEFQPTNSAIRLARVRRIGMLAKNQLITHDKILENALRAEEGLPAKQE